MSTVADSEVNSGLNEEQRKATPLPRLQLFITYLIQFAEPIAGLVIYPFINQFIRDTGITKGDETKTGYYAGVIESTYFLAQCLTVVQWGYLSDRFGRRPVLLLGPLGLSVSMLLFGLSTTFWPLVIFRCLQGSFNGNIGVSKTVIAEITDKTNIGDAYAYSLIMWISGSTIAPFIGGVLSQPAERWPDTLGRFPFFKSHPYFLPSATASFIAFLSFVIAFFALEETLPSVVEKRRKTQQLHADAETPLIGHSENVSYGAVTSTVGVIAEANENRKSSSYTLLHRPLVLVFLNYAFLTFLSMANFVLIPLMYSTPLEYGGLGLSPFAIGTLLGTFGMINAIFQIKFLGRLMRHFGTRCLYRSGMLSLCVNFVMYPVMAYAAQRAGGIDGYVIVCIAIHLASKAPLSMANASLQVLIVETVPEGGSLGIANGFAQMLASAMRAIAPILTSSLFSLSLQRNLANGNLIYYLLLAMSLLGARMSWLLQDPTHTMQKRSSQTPNASTS